MQSGSGDSAAPNLSSFRGPKLLVAYPVSEPRSAPTVSICGFRPQAPAKNPHTFRMTLDRPSHFKPRP